MNDAVLFLLVLLLGAISFYLVYERMKAQASHTDSSKYLAALRALLDKKEESAFSLLRQVIAEDTTNVDAYLRLGQLLRRHRQPERALQIHKDLTLRSGLSREERMAILRQLAADYVAVSEPATAVRALRELISLDSRDRWAHAALLQLQESARDWEGAFATASDLLKIDANQSKKMPARLKLNEGEELYRKREFHKARVALKEAMAMDPSLSQAYLLIGDSYYDEKRFEDAVAIWSKLITAVPEQGQLVIERLKRTLYELGRYGDIVDLCQAILEHDPKNAESRRTLARFHEKKGDIESAIEILDELVEDNPDDSIASLELGRLLIERGDRRKLDQLVRTLTRRTGDPRMSEEIRRNDPVRLSL